MKPINIHNNLVKKNRYHMNNRTSIFHVKYSENKIDERNIKINYDVVKNDNIYYINMNYLTCCF